MTKILHAKTFWIIFLGIGAVIITIVFMMYTRYIEINNNASVSPNEDTFKVVFSSGEDYVLDGEVIGNVIGDATASIANINNSKQDSIIENLSVKFTEPGQSVTYKFYTYNVGKYEAFLNSVNFANATVDGKDGGAFKVCTTESEMDITEACNNITFSIKIGSSDNQLEFKSSQTNIPATHILNADTSEPVEITIAYVGNVYAEAFNVDFGDITLIYESVD